jgi:hypothetical protein
MLVKRGNAEIIKVIEDDEHKLDDEGTRKAMERAAKKQSWSEVLAAGGSTVEPPKDTEKN